MKLTFPVQQQESATPARDVDDRFKNQGRNMLMNAFHTAVDRQAELSADEREKRDQEFPLHLPDALKQPNVRKFAGAKKGKRGMTALEAAEAAKVEKAKRQRVAEQEDRRSTRGKHDSFKVRKERANKEELAAKRETAKAKAAARKKVKAKKLRAATNKRVSQLTDFLA
ncbi:MAG: hypothetical protein MMC33_010858 [Icmadophila ericetorum]|nr:hypothetical protein [Icmadophila ericetorum]